MSQETVFLTGTAEVTVQGDIAADTLTGLSSLPKYLLSKYLYDDTGSAIFREIMNMPGYYLTGCEYEIFSEKSLRISELLTEGAAEIRIIEPGSGDGLKTTLLLEALRSSGIKFSFLPVDISPHANDILKDSILRKLQDIDIQPITGDYFNVLENIDNYDDDARNVILFLGSNIGNLNNSELNLFLGNISKFTRSGDRVLIGFDLKKAPSVIMKAYDDPQGLTKTFNIKHLRRLNRELNADFNTDLFEHHTEYNPVTGELKSFLVSVTEQDVNIGLIGESFHFGRWEPLFMELSRKFDFRGISLLAHSHGFRIIENFTDNNGWFTDSLWIRI